MSDQNDITLYLVGQYKIKSDTFDLQGIFSTESKAMIACKNSNYFINPLKLDKYLPHESIKWKGYYPKCK